jgi:hypothetical protein
MIRNKYNYEDDEPVIIKKRKTREKPTKEVKEADEPEVYKILRETREARNKPSSKAELDEDEDEEEVVEKVVNTTPLVKAVKPIIEPVRKPDISAFHPVQLKYDDKFISSLKNENDDLKKHLADLRQFHSYNDRLNSVHHIAHRMKIKLSQF